ncbi:MAG: hypothetical protein KDB27_32995, partial [Planctomycetales bacterium]|nr:hypothetical protein [Planctomycetales bacterium]
VPGAAAAYPFTPAQVLQDFTTAQNLGNVLTQDRGVISVAGSMDPAGDVDAYVFSVGYEDVQSGGGTVDLGFDIDFADGLARADLAFSIYELLEQTKADPQYTGTEPELLDNPTGPEYMVGNLLFVSNTNSRIPDDQPRPNRGDDVDQLDQGSVGTHDPFAGPLTFAPGSYVLLIYPDSLMSTKQDQYFNDTNATDPFYREEPSRNIVRIADDHINGDPALITETLDGPVLPVLVNRRNVVPYTLGDVELFVTTQTGLASVDPFTGKREVRLGSYLTADGLLPTVGDIALRDNPVFSRWAPNPETGLPDDVTDATRRQRLHAFGLFDGNGGGLINDATVGNYLWIDIDPQSLPPQAGSVLIRGTGENGVITDDGLETYLNLQNEEMTANWTDMPNVQRAGDTQEGVGILFDALTFGLPNAIGDIDVGYAIGNRSAQGQVDDVGNRGITNILYKFNAADGSIVSATGADRPETELYAIPNNNPVGFVPPDGPDGPLTPNAGTQIVEAGVLDTTVCMNTSTSLYEACPRRPGPELVQEFGGNITGIAFLGSSLYGITDEGHLFRITGQDGEGATARYQASILDDAGNLVGFEGLTAGPSSVESRAYRDLLFGVTGRGDLYAFNADGELQPIFVDGQTSVSTGVGGAVGLEFGTLDENLWKTTMDRGGDAGHSGGNSLFFGEDTATAPGNDPRYYDFAGGAHGSIVSNEFSLEGYGRDDLPVLYFTYLAMTEFRNLNDSAATGPAFLNRLGPQDSFRVFITDDSAEIGRGQWHLVATNQVAELGDITDINANDTVNTNAVQLFDNSWQDVPNAAPPVGQLNAYTFIGDGARDSLPFANPPFEFDNWPALAGSALDESASVWRQAKIDLSDFVGSDSLRLRFDFSTNGSFDYGGASSTGGAELRGIDASKINDGDTFVIDGQTFEFDLGATVRGVPGKRIQDGETLSLTDADGLTVVLEFDRNGSVAGNAIAIAIDDEMSSNAVADEIETAVGNSGLNVVIHRTLARLNFENAATVVGSAGGAIAIEGNPGTTGISVVINGGFDENDVAEAMRQPIADTFANGNIDVIKSFGNVVRIIGHAVDD